MKYMDIERKEGREEGIQIGEVRGIKKGESRLLRLNELLLNNNRIDDLKRAVSDAEFREIFIKSTVYN